MKPTKGRVVLVTTPDFLSNGDTEHVALITRVWSEEMINTMVLPDGGAPMPVTSVTFADPPHETQRSWRWPPRE